MLNIHSLAHLCSRTNGEYPAPWTVSYIHVEKYQSFYDLGTLKCICASLWLAVMQYSNEFHYPGVCMCSGAFNIKMDRGANRNLKYPFTDKHKMKMHTPIVEKIYT